MKLAVHKCQRQKLQQSSSVWQNFSRLPIVSIFSVGNNEKRFEVQKRAKLSLFFQPRRNGCTTSNSPKKQNGTMLCATETCSASFSNFVLQFCTWKILNSVCNCCWQDNVGGIRYIHTKSIVHRCCHWPHKSSTSLYISLVCINLAGCVQNM